MDEYEDDGWTKSFIHPTVVFFIQNSKCLWQVEFLLCIACCDESTSSELLSDLLSDLRKLLSAMEPGELSIFEEKELEEEDEEDTHMRNNTFTSLLGFVCPIFKPEPDTPQVFQIFKIYSKGHQIRVILSDGYDLEHAVVAPELIQHNPITMGSIVEINRHSMHFHIEKKFRLIMIHELKVLDWRFRIIGLDSLEYGIWPFGGEWSESDWEEKNYRRLDFDDWYNWEEDIEEYHTIVRTRLSTDALVAINVVSSAYLQPTLQIVDIRTVGIVGITKERFRMILSDGKHVQQSFLGTDQLIQKAKTGLFVKGSIVTLLNFEWRTISNRRILFVLNMNPFTIGGGIISNPDPRPIYLGPDFSSENIGPSTQDKVYQAGTDD